jgi:putative transposase
MEPVRLPPRSPNLTPHIERFMRSVKDECLHRMVFFGERAVQAGADPETASLSTKDKRIVRIPALERRIAAAALSR